MKTAIFPGSFNPFTIGHKWIVDQALKTFDKIIIVFSTNSEKSGQMPLYERMERVRHAYAGDERIEVIQSNELTMDVANRYNADIIRGIRNVTDFEYEKTMCDINRKFGGVNTFFIISDEEHGSISSSLVRELIKYGKDVSNLIV